MSKIDINNLTNEQKRLINKYKNHVVNGKIYYYWSLDKNGSFRTSIANRIYFQTPKLTENVYMSDGTISKSFYFISAHFLEIIKKDDDLISALNNLSQIEIQSTRDSILEQINSYQEKISQINLEIANILKVLAFEINISTDYEKVEDKLGIHDLVINNLKMDSINRIQRLWEMICNGEFSKKIETKSLSLINKSSNFVSNHLINSSVWGIKSLLQDRDPILKHAVEFVIKLKHVEERRNKFLLILDSESKSSPKEMVGDIKKKSNKVKRTDKVKQESLKVEIMIDGKVQILTFIGNDDRDKKIKERIEALMETNDWNRTSARGQVAVEFKLSESRIAQIDRQVEN